MKSAAVRKAAFAGSWYPASAAECEQQISGFLAESDRFPPPQTNLVGGIVPHAGWYFSGSIACNVIRSLKNGDDPDVIVVFGMHLHPTSPCFIMPEGVWETPFGILPVETRLANELIKHFRFTLETPNNFTQDNTIELQLPFIKYFFSNTKIVAVGVPPDNRSLEIGRSVVSLSRRLDLRIKVIGSTDLTHYGANYGFTSRGTGPAAVDWVRNENDRRVIDAMLALDPEKVIAEARTNHNACCAGAVATAIEAGKQLGARRADKIAYATSHDKSPADSFVGYVGIVF